MNLTELRARLNEIVAQLDGFNAADLSQEQINEIEALNTEFSEIKAKIEAAEKIEEMKAAASTSVGRKTAPAAATIEVGVDRKTLDPKAGFKTRGEFFSAVIKAASRGGERDKRLFAGAQEKYGEDGGFLIPEDFRNVIQEKVQGDESLLPKTAQFQTGSNLLVLPTSEVAPWDGTGIQAYWEGEGASHTDSKHKFGQTSIKLHKLTASVRVTEELMDDAQALESYINLKAPEAIVHKINSAIISGSGVGMPEGLLNSGFKYKVAKESGQAADSVVFENVNKMVGRILPKSLSKAVWLVNPQVLPQLPLMKFDSAATSPVPVYLPATGVAGAPYGTLYGRPLMPMMGGVKALGDEGDLMLVDLSYYYTAYKTAGIKQSVSTHVYFNTDEVAFKFVTRLGGLCPFKSPVQTENGAFDMSAFVTLADRA